MEVSCESEVRKLRNDAFLEYTCVWYREACCNERNSSSAMYSKSNSERFAIPAYHLLQLSRHEICVNLSESVLRECFVAFRLRIPHHSASASSIHR